MDKNWLLTLKDVDVNDLALVGGKAYNLGNLNRHGLNTPSGLIITTTFLEAQINHYAYTPIWAGSPDVAVTEGALQFLADFLKSTPLASHLNKAFQKELNQLYPMDIQTFAVRSSAVDEDQRDRSFAGCHLTELHVPRPLLTISLTRCWASALMGRAVEYRLQHGMSLQAIKIAVIIQPMLTPVASGVAFTLNPANGARNEFVIEATTGLGEAVVSGRIKPYTYFLKRQPPTYPLVRKIVGDTAKLTHEPLSIAQLTELGQVLDRIEALMGEPQDVEWAYQDNTLHLLQTRPVSVTVADSPDAVDLEFPFNTEWTRGSYPETLPELPSPLLTSLMSRTENRAIQHFTDLGLNVSDFGPYIKTIYGRPYLNLTVYKRVLAQLGFDPLPLLTLVGYTEASSVTNPFKFSWQAIWQARKVYFRLMIQIFQTGQLVENFHQIVYEMVTELKDTEITSPRLLTEFKLREQVYGDSVVTGLGILATLTGLMTVATKLILPIVSSRAKLLGLLGTLGKNPVTIYHNSALLELARQALAEPEVAAYLNRPHRDYVNYHHVLKDTKFLSQFKAHLQTYGHHATYESDMGYPRLIENPHLLLKTINQYVKLISQGDVSQLPVASRPTFWQIWLQTVHNAKGIHRWLPWRQLLALPVMALLNQTFGLRNNLLDDLCQAITVIRAWDINLAKKWVKDDFLETVEDYFWLTMPEIEHALVTEDDITVYLKPAVHARKIAYQAYAKFNVPFVIKDIDIPMLTLPDNEKDEILNQTIMGLPVSPGQVQGIVRFLQDFERLDQVPQGSILVTPSTDPAYFPFFPLASGLIVEMGGMLSHGSIIAREYGLPAVSNITNARNQFSSGDRVLLDGSTGVVQILEKAKPEKRG